MPDAIVLDGRKTPTTVQRRREGEGLLLRQGYRYVVLDADELDQVLDFVTVGPSWELATFKRRIRRLPQARGDGGADRRTAELARIEPCLTAP